MEAHHASLGRRTLEEIRQKRAADRMHKASSGSDLEASNSQGGASKGGGGGGVPPVENNSVLLSRVKELEKKMAELEDANKKQLLKLDENGSEKSSLLKHLKDLEENMVPSLRKALNDALIEKDAAIVAREDVVAQLRTLKRHLKQAEEEQYRAEEDAASLRAELNMLQQQENRNPYVGTAMSDLTNQIQNLEKENMELKSQLQQELLFRQQEQQKLAEQQVHVSSLLAENQEMEKRLTEFSKRSLEEAHEEDARKALLQGDKEKLEKQLHDMALMVERLESGRQKLMMEIDSQSSEIERLFEENATLLASYHQSITATAQWQNQVKECLKQNEYLREQMDRLRLDPMNSSDTKSKHIFPQIKTANDIENLSDLCRDELLPVLKNLLAKEQSKSEKLSAEVVQLTAELQTAVQSYHDLTQLYKPILRNIEKSLMRMKQDNVTLY